MLILTRRAGESIVIGGDVVVTIVEAGRDQVRVGIEAPRNVAVHRQEVYAEISRENEAARAASPSADSGRTGKPTAVSAASLPRAPKR
jgi:carbon storage regulator